MMRSHASTADSVVVDSMSTKKSQQMQDTMSFITDIGTFKKSYQLRLAFLSNLIKTSATPKQLVKLKSSNELLGVAIWLTRVLTLDENISNSKRIALIASLSWSIRGHDCTAHAVLTKAFPQTVHIISSWQLIFSIISPDYSKAFVDIESHKKGQHVSMFLKLMHLWHEKRRIDSHTLVTQFDLAIMEISHLSQYNNQNDHILIPLSRLTLLQKVTNRHNERCVKCRCIIKYYSLLDSIKVDKSHDRDLEGKGLYFLNNEGYSVEEISDFTGANDFDFEELVYK